ncbi:C1 family peptidase [Aestuariibaculum sediminum]|uniref:Aminopeptidase n=1 Tax=Aestuariibaculum sediminum TaxID=2770637 RepID=A0A8J6U7L1_9FLAO|nr:C1 family peptidase [Aestuariibaculum sediminum]MBD0832123.1 aminopeptidase [Aestuariibaculum sediminum]
MKNSLLIFTFMLFLTYGTAQKRDFKTIYDIEATEVLSQGVTGTCWSFSTSSFLESEIIRKTGKTIDLSEMYNVRHTYLAKAWNYVMRQGKAQFSQGGLAHDVINSIEAHGLVPNSVFTGLVNNETSYNHKKLEDTLKTILDTYLKAPKKYTGNWENDINDILDAKIGNDITTFNYQGKTYTPKAFLEYTKINPKDYITLTSFTHIPFNEWSILNIPDNFSNGLFYNVPLKTLVEITNEALKKGYTIELDCDVSEKSFSSKYGLAIIPEQENFEIPYIFKDIVPEKEINQEYRQQEFENFNTTDDHLMHITGMLKDQNGTIFYKVKNSWGKNSDRVNYGGYIYMSEAYFKLKTISIMVNKNAINKKFTKKRLNN